MKICIIRNKATKQQVKDMLEALTEYIKVAVDVDQGILAGGGVMHADCEQALIEDGSKQVHVWGADWYPKEKRVEFGSLINIRSRQNNRSMELKDPLLRKKVKAIIR